MSELDILFTKNIRPRTINILITKKNSCFKIRVQSKNRILPGIGLGVVVVVVAVLLVREPLEQLVQQISFVAG